jgi:phosphonate transport system substrate-binding protein
MAPNADAMCRKLAGYLGQRLQTEVELVEGVSWSERERRFDAGDVDLCWICGLPYVEKFDNGRSIAVGVAPVMNGERYRGVPVYFSDVMVRADSSLASFADLREQRWAFNEPRSHSGFNVVRHHLATLGHSFSYFGEMVEAGTHQSALRMVISGAVAGAAIDSTVLEAEARDDPASCAKVRAISTLGPSPAPPWVFAATVPHAVRQSVTRCLEEMHHNREGAAVLAGWGIAELRAVTDAFYNPIRRMRHEDHRLQTA